MSAVAPTDPPPQRLAVPGGFVSVALEGPREAPPVLLVHGAPGSQRDFRYLSPALAARGLLAVRLDMPGFGETPLAVWPRLDPRSRAAFLRNVARALGLSRPAVVGHSIGGTAALALAGLYPDEVSALALVNSVGTRRHRGLTVPEKLALAVEPALKVPAFAGPLLDLARENAGRLGFPRAEVAALDVEKLLVQAGLIGSLDFALFRALARRVRCPTLVVSAEDDPMVGPRVSHSLADALCGPGEHVHLHLAEGGHYLQKHAAGQIALHLEELIAGERVSN